MRRLYVSCAVLLACLPALPAAPPEVDPVRLPLIEVVAPKPPPATVTRLGAEQLYVGVTVNGGV